MNFGVAKARFRQMVGNLTVTQLTDAIAGDYVNEAQRQVSVEYKFREVRCIKSFATIVGTTRYILPTDLWALRTVRDDTNKREIVGPYGDKTLSRLPVRTNGYPVRYIRERDWIQFDPPPAYVITIKLTYTKKLSGHTSDTDLLILPEDWHYLVCLRARWLYYSDTQDYPKAQNAWNTFELLAAKHPLPLEKEMDEKDIPAEFVELGTISQRHGVDFDRVDD